MTLLSCRYAIAMAFKSDQRVIYTSPLKALSNQKFRWAFVMLHLFLHMCTMRVACDGIRDGDV